MSHARIPFELADERKTPRPPNGKLLIVHVVVNVEVWPADQPMPRGILTPPGGGTPAAVPDVPNWCWAEYGLRVGMPRLFRVLGDRKLPATCAINSDVIKVYPRVAERILEAEWEWMGHGVFQRTLKAVPDEHAVIAEAKAAVENFTGKKVHGWLGPALQETFDTPDVLKELGFDYVCEWCLDDLPSWMKTKHGPFLSIPYSLESNDVVISALEKHTAQEFFERVDRTVDCFEKEGNLGPRIVTLPLHPHLMGVPHRIGYLEKTLDMLLNRTDTIFMSGQQIANWFMEEPALI